MENYTTKIKLDIGSGVAKFEDYLTVDRDLSVGADLVIDIEDAQDPMDWIINTPQGVATLFKSCDEIRAHHILEHINPENKVKVMALFFDLLKPGGILDIEVPLFPHPASVQDPTHISFWCKESFWYFMKGNDFAENFKKRYSVCQVPLFDFVSDEFKGEVPWAYKIILKRPL